MPLKGPDRDSPLEGICKLYIQASFRLRLVTRLRLVIPYRPCRAPLPIDHFNLRQLQMTAIVIPVVPTAFIRDNGQNILSPA